MVDAARLLTSEDVGSLPVVAGEELVGMVTDRDLVLRVLARDLDPHTTSVGDACTQDPATDEPLDAALLRMAAKRVGRRWRTARRHPRPGRRPPDLAGDGDGPDGRRDLRETRSRS